MWPSLLLSTKSTGEQYAAILIWESWVGKLDFTKIMEWDTLADSSSSKALKGDRGNYQKFHVELCDMDLYGEKGFLQNVKINFR